MGREFVHLEELVWEAFKESSKPEFSLGLLSRHQVYSIMDGSLERIECGGEVREAHIHTFLLCHGDRVNSLEAEEENKCLISQKEKTISYLLMEKIEHLDI